MKSCFILFIISSIGFSFLFNSSKTSIGLKSEATLSAGQLTTIDTLPKQIIFTKDSVFNNGNDSVLINDRILRQTQEAIYYRIPGSRSLKPWIF